jgi:hypothetical protein
LIRKEADIRAKIQDSMKALEDFAGKTEVEPEDFFTVARQATFLTALYWVLGEDIPDTVKKLAVPIVKKMSAAQVQEAVKAKEVKK